VVPTPYTVSAPTGIGSPANLIDRDQRTGVRFDVMGDAVVKTDLSVDFSSSTLVSGFVLNLGQNVTFPLWVEVRGVGSDGEEKILLTTGSLSSERINFLATEVMGLRVRFEHIQPLYLTELIIIEDRPEQTVRHGLRWLALPQRTYDIYLNPDHSVRIPTGEAGDLRGDLGVMDD
jgi:hypothetical protein